MLVLGFFLQLLSWYLVPEEVRKIEVGMKKEQVDARIPESFERKAFSDLFDPDWPPASEAREWIVISIEVNSSKVNYHIQGGNIICSHKFIVSIVEGAVENIEIHSYPFHENMLDELSNWVTSR